MGCLHMFTLSLSPTAISFRIKCHRSLSCQLWVMGRWSNWSNLSWSWLVPSKMTTKKPLKNYGTSMTWHLIPCLCSSGQEATKRLKLSGWVRCLAFVVMKNVDLMGFNGIHRQQYDTTCIWLGLKTGFPQTIINPKKGFCGQNDRPWDGYVFVSSQIWT